MTNKIIITAVADVIRSWRNDQIMDLHNRYCDNKGFPERRIWHNGEEFFREHYANNLSGIAKDVHNGVYDPDHDWVWYVNNTELQSLETLVPCLLPDEPETIAQHVLDYWEEYKDLFEEI
jgi:hypothetical protein